MKISCICPTFSRVSKNKHLLDEAIQSFLVQDHADKELIIINDCPSQVLIFDHPEVKIFNLSERFKTLGEKYNWGIRASSGQAICTWEDDDVSLPHRLSSSVERLGDFDYWNPRGYWFMDTRGLHHEHGMGVSHNASIFTRKAFDEVGGYPASTGPQDAQMDGLLRKRGNVSNIVITKQPWEWSYIYRWGVSDLHISGQSNMQLAYDDYARLHPPKAGQFFLKPSWKMDYTQQCLEHLTAKV